MKEEGLAQIAKNAIETEKLDGLYVNGSSGENFLLSKEQKETSLQSRKRSGQ
ncbi:N-acetylneuraminate lyase [Staphylococcus saprophyticus subsp. saprophyticus KACC 16562]|nr:N-acetylneuraminate lyase [Staphylococcus saprophyticus subsp. saprophyticus KACC 16562]